MNPKPHIRRIKGQPFWVCGWRFGDPDSRIGSTPDMAFALWLHGKRTLILRAELRDEFPFSPMIK